MITSGKVSIAVCVALAALLCLAPTVVAAEFAVASSADLALAIESADAGGIIRLSDDIALDERLPKITADITIEGGGFTISGADEFSIFFVGGGANVTLNHLNLVDGKADYCIAWDVDHKPHAKDCNDDYKHSVGGAILNIGGELTVKNCSFRDNLTNGDGGAISSFRGSLEIVDSQFTKNRADYGGGAIYAYRGMLSIRNSQFASNEAWTGGALNNIGGDVTIIGSSFSGNTSGEGGAIYNHWSSEITVTKSRFTGNSAEDGGGAIGNQGALSIADSIFRGNRSADDGGAISSYGDPDLTVNGSSFIDNIAEGNGGAVKNSGAMSIADSTFRGNSSADDGGAISSYGDPDLDVDGCSFIDNIAGGYGGAISMNAWDKAQTLSNSSFGGNTAGESGGGIYFRFGAVTLTHLTMTDNSAQHGGGIYVGDEGHGGDVFLSNSLITGSEGGDCVFQKYEEMKENVGNLIADGSCAPALSGDPGLGEVIEPEYGSPPFTPLEAGSRAIDAADSDNCMATDQRGRARPQGAGCDIGAFEYAG